MYSLSDHEMHAKRRRCTDSSEIQTSFRTVRSRSQPHERLHTVHQQHLQYLAEVSKKTQQFIRIGYVFGFPGFAEQREESPFLTPREEPAPQTRIEGGVNHQRSEDEHNENLLRN